MSRSRGGDDGSVVDSGVGASLSDERPERLREGSDEEGDVTNVGLSRNPTEDPKRPRRKSSSIHEKRPATSDRARRPSSSKREREALFTPEDLELALKKSNLEATKEESDHSKDATPKAADDSTATTRAVAAVPSATTCSNASTQETDLEKIETNTDSVTGVLYTDYEDCDDECTDSFDGEDDHRCYMEYEREPRPRERMVSYVSSKRHSSVKPIPSMLDV